MRIRKGTKTEDGGSGLDNLLQSLHGETTSNVSGDGNAGPDTLADASRQTVDQLLDRVGTRRQKRLVATSQRSVLLGPLHSIALRGHVPFPPIPLISLQSPTGGFTGHMRGTKQNLVEGEDALLHQRRLFGEGTSQRNSASEVVCGTRARTTQELEQRQSVEPHNSALHSSNPPQQSVKEEDKAFVDEEELVWEDGDDGVQGAHNHTTHIKGWTGEVTFEAKGSPTDGPNKRQKKPALRRANANDKLFAVQVHMAHLLCLLGRGRMVSNASDDPLLQASLVSVLPPRLLPSASLDRVTISRLEHLVSWFQSHFRLLLAGEGSSKPLSGIGGESFQTRLTEVLQKQAGSAEELAALSVALFRGLGFTCRYVTVLDVASIKPDAESLDASVDWDCGAPFHHSRIGTSFLTDLRHQVTELSRVLSRRVPQFATNGDVSDTTQTILSATETEIPGSQEIPVSSSAPKARGRGGRGLGQGRGRGRGQHLNPNQNQNTVASGQSSASIPGKVYNRRGRKPNAQLGVDGGVSSSKGGLEIELQKSTSKRKGDEEYEAQVAMALAATAAAAKVQEVVVNKDDNKDSTVKGLNWVNQKLGGGKSKLFEKEGRAGTSGAVWSRKMGPVLHWAEVYCGGEGSTGRWMHVDATRGIVDGANQVEGAAASCRFPLRYVVAFAGSGAKDVTRRYVSLWSSIAPLRVETEWWDSTLLPLKQLEATATSGPAGAASLSVPKFASNEKSELNEIGQQDESGTHPTISQESSGTELKNTVSHHATIEVAHTPSGDIQLFNPRSVREDLEMDTKLYTEPLPTNQQAYKNHHLYVLEKWLTKYETLYPKGPVLGYCAGQPVYRRACVQTLHTSDRWLRECRKVKVGELAAKIVKSRAVPKEGEDLYREEGRKEATMIELFGKWQTEEWQPPRAVGGIVPRNERGQVDVWSEKCLPPGTVHLRFPRLVPVCQRLGINFAPAMVGFEIQKGRSIPVYEGLVVCEEFKDAIMEAYFEEEDARNIQMQKKREEQAASRWRQLLLSVGTRKRLRETYQGTAGDDLVNSSTITTHKKLSYTSNNTLDHSPLKAGEKSGGKEVLDPQHVHHYDEENQSYDEESGMRTKWCVCGFRIEVEEM